MPEIVLRPFQKEALSLLLQPYSKSQHVLCVAPTGSGKSLIYERASSLPGTKTLLVTPLIALARQQHQKLKSIGINVLLGAGKQGSLAPGPETEAWIISPEMLNYTSRQAQLKTWAPNFLVVDECHCLWEWGEKFRPSFNQIPKLISELPIQRSLWLTATLPFEARQKLRETLPQPLKEVGEFKLPPKLLVEVRKTPWIKRASELVQWILQQPDPGMIFVPTRESTVRLKRLVAATGRTVLVYHAGMSKEERQSAELLVSKQIPDVIIATSAFGMGMDYPHLRYVVLWQAPPSLLNLVQSIGRVGRNHEQDAKALIFWDDVDFQMLEWTIQDSDKRRIEMLSVLEFLSTTKCRGKQLKFYFDQKIVSESCNQCDHCVKLKNSNQLPN